MNVVVLAPDSLRGASWTCWVADQVAARLKQEGIPVRRRPPPRLVRGTWTVPVAPGGVAYFGHGWDGHVVGNELAPLLDEHNIADLAGLWLYVFACGAGHSLLRDRVPPLTHAVGYDGRITADIVPDRLYPTVRAALIELLCVVPLALAKGTLDRRTLLRDVLAQGDALLLLVDEHGGPGLAELVDHLTLKLRIDAER